MMSERQNLVRDLQEPSRSLNPTWRHSSYIHRLRLQDFEATHGSLGLKAEEVEMLSKLNFIKVQRISCASCIIPTNHLCLDLENFKGPLPCQCKSYGSENVYVALTTKSNVVESVVFTTLEYQKTMQDFILKGIPYLIKSKVRVD
jgi:hypothetical protein